MNTKLATSRMRTGQWADIIKDCKERYLKVDDYWALIILAFKYHCILYLEAPNPGAETCGVNYHSDVQGHILQCIYGN